MTKAVCTTCGQPIDQEVLPPIKIGHRPQIFTQALADQILDRIVQGDSLARICKDPEMPGLTTVRKWVRERPTFAMDYARAREDQADTLADQIIDIADDRSKDWVQDPTTEQWRPDHDQINRSRLRVEARKWVASKLKPKKYGERVEARLTGEITTRNINVNIDSSHLTAEQRQLLRAAIMPQLAGPQGESEKD